MEAKEEREVISYQHGYQDGKKAGEKYALSKEGHEAISYLEGHQEGIDKGRKEVVEFINDLIIGIDGCKFEERLDGDKGCIVLDMNENQWRAMQKEWGL